MPSGPLSQLPMEQIPPTPATVSYEGGLLTISAQNSSLSEILRDVRQLTGASIEIPQGPGANERVVTHLGPGAPRDVLAGLLNGSSFNYVMLGSSSDPSVVSSVMLMPKPSSPGDVQTAANVYEESPAVVAAAPATPNRFPRPMPFNQQNVNQVNVGQLPGSIQPLMAQPANGDAEEKDDDADADDNSDDSAQAQPGQPDANAQDQQQPDPNQPNAGPKTPEQILEMMRKPQQPGGAAATPPQPPQE
jgi:hypothetical protein